MAFSTNNNDSEPIAAINVVPLVDVMLVLLVIFMITAPIMQQGVEVKLPKATTAPLEGSTEQVVVSVNKDGKIFIGAGNEVIADELGVKVAAILERRPEEERKVYINADEAISYGTIMEYMGKVHAAGIRNIGLISEPADAVKANLKR